MTERTPIKRGDRVLVWATVREPCNAVEPGRMWWIEIDGKPFMVAMDEGLFIVAPHGPPLYDIIKEINCGPHQDCTPDTPCACRDIAKAVETVLEQGALVKAPESRRT